MMGAFFFAIVMRMILCCVERSWVFNFREGMLVEEVIILIFICFPRRDLVFKGSVFVFFDS